METKPALSGVCEILSRLWSINKKKTKSKNRVAVEFDKREFDENSFELDDSIDFVS